MSAGAWSFLRRSAGMVANFAAGGITHVNLQVTRRCNFRCRICDFWREEQTRETDPAPGTIREISERLARFGTLVVSIAGGEPTIREDLPEIVAAVARRHFPIMITNGWFATRESARDLWAAGLAEVSVSVDYASAARHDALRDREGAFAQAVAALGHFREGRRSPRNRVHMIAVLMDDNVDEIEEMILLARRLGVTFMVNLYSGERGRKPWRLPRENVSRRLLDLKRRYPEFVSLTAYLEKIDLALRDGGVGGCRAGRLFFNVDPRGNVARCTETTDLPVGNILTGDPAAIREKLVAMQRADGCGKCFTSCRGWAEAMHGEGRIRTWREFLGSVGPAP